MDNLLDKINAYLNFKNNKLHIFSQERFFYYMENDTYIIESVLMDGKSQPTLVFKSNKIDEFNAFLTKELIDNAVEVKASINRTVIGLENEILDLNESLEVTTNNYNKLQDDYDSLDEENGNNLKKLNETCESLSQTTNSRDFMVNLINYILKNM